MSLCLLCSEGQKKVYTKGVFHKPATIITCKNRRKRPDTGFLLRSRIGRVYKWLLCDTKGKG